jgi:hypothetical protein
MRPRLVAMVVAAVFPLMASAEEPVQPKFPPGFDCSSVAAGSQRQACNRSQLNPPMGSIPDTKAAKPDGFIRDPKPAMPPTGKPPTIPRLPGTIDGGF